MERLATAIPGCYELVPRVSHDRRGTFTKIFQSSALADLLGDFEVAEIYHSRSAPGVVRGLHFQLPPADMTKLVTCVAGTALDVVVDLRTDSPTYGRATSFELTADRDSVVVVPRGCAHGFAATSRTDALLLYVQDQEFDAGCDTGIHWSSVDVAWPVTEPVVSDRDAALAPLAEFDSPFRIES